LAAGVLAALAVLSWGQCHYWRDDVALWEHTLEITGPDNPFAQRALGLALSKRGQYAEALPHFVEAVRGASGSAEIRGCFGSALLVEGYRDEAAAQLQFAVTHLPETKTLQHDLGVALYELGRISEAAEHFRAAIALDPGFSQARYRLGQCLARQGDVAGAETCLRAAVDLEPGSLDYRTALAHALSRKGDATAAAAEYAAAARIKPGWTKDGNLLAWSMATNPVLRRRDPVGAMDMAERVCDATGGKVPEYLDVLAAAYAAADRFEDAAATARKALALLPAGAPEQLTGALKARLNLYERRQPLPGGAAGRAGPSAGSALLTNERPGIPAQGPPP
jgi:tetratricopeptide (TPR) repeat protein